MSNLFLATIKKVLETPTSGISSAMVKIDSNADNLGEIHQLTVKEYLAVAGGPQVENEPD